MWTGGDMASPCNMAPTRDFPDYPRPSLAVDPVALTVKDGRLLTVLWRRANQPYKGQWALPGVFVNVVEDLDTAVQRALTSKAGITTRVEPEQLFTWNRPNRDPRGWVVTIAYYSLINKSELERLAPSDNACVFELLLASYGAEQRSAAPSSAGKLQVRDLHGRLLVPAFDHRDILESVIRRLRSIIWQSDVALRILPEQFSLREMQTVYETILGRPLNKDSFRRRVTKTQRLVAPSGQTENGVGHRPAELYQRAELEDIL
jgi:8-oxo-dGTP diphosphatase